METVSRQKKVHSISVYDLFMRSDDEWHLRPYNSFHWFIPILCFGGERKLVCLFVSNFACIGLKKIENVKSSYDFGKSISSTRFWNEFQFFEPRLTSQNCHIFMTVCWTTVFCIRVNIVYFVALVCFCISVASCVIQFTYTDRYPDELPVMEITSSENLSDESVDSILSLMTRLVKSQFFCFSLQLLQYVWSEINY